MGQTPPDRGRIEMLGAALETAFGPATGSERVEIVRAPGRVNLIGDHMEYNEGFALPAAIELDTWIALRRREDDIVRVVSRHSHEAGSFRIDTLAPGAAGPSGRWSDYVAGTAWSLREADVPIRGFDGVIDTTLPIGGGLASSAALELASALALIGRDRIIAPPSLAAMAQRAERDYIGLDAGIMDQLASAAGREDRALLLDCRSLDTRHVTMPYGVRVVVCDTGEKRDQRSTAYATRRAECARAVALLAERMPGLCSLRDLDAASLRRYRAILPENVAVRAEHVVAENARVLATASALEAGDLDALGRIFAESQASLRDLYGVSSPALDAMVEVALSIPGVVAARMTGMGFGGCTVNLVLSDAVPALQAAVGRAYDGRTGLHGHVYSVAVVDGAGPVATE
jgi:galactokinase